MVCLLAAPWVPLSVSAGCRWPHNALRHHWLIPISCTSEIVTRCWYNESDSCKWCYNKCPDLCLYRLHILLLFYYLVECWCVWCLSTVCSRRSTHRRTETGYSSGYQGKQHFKINVTWSNSERRQIENDQQQNIDTAFWYVSHECQCRMFTCIAVYVNKIPQNIGL